MAKSLNKFEEANTILEEMENEIPETHFSDFFIEVLISDRDLQKKLKRIS